MKIAYLLHRFPGKTDTFIKREIEGLRKLGANVEVISIWRPKENESTPEIMSDWSDLTNYFVTKYSRQQLKIAIFFCFSSSDKDIQSILSGKQDVTSWVEKLPLSVFLLHRGNPSCQCYRRTRIYTSAQSLWGPEW